MTCKNCGAKLRDNAKVCTNCGAFVDDSSGYTLLAADDRVYDVYSSDKKKKKNGGAKFVIALLIIALIAGIGAYVYFGKIVPSKNKQPSLTFSEGSGLINRNQKVIFVSIPKGADVQYIHGVSLYDYDKTAVDDLRKPITTDYEYTKNIDSTFRAIYFDMKDFNVEKGVNHTYTFEMLFSFNGSDKIYTYQHKVTIDGTFEKDVSDSVFDHSLTGENGETLQNGKKPKTTKKQENFKFIYEGYWYTAPNSEGDTKSISAFKFNKDKTYTVTNYIKHGTADWVVDTDKGKYQIKDGTLTLNEGGSFEIDSENEEISESNDGQKTQTLTSRKYNSIQNTEDFFGL